MINVSAIIFTLMILILLIAKHKSLLFRSGTYTINKLLIKRDIFKNMLLLLDENSIFFPPTSKDLKKAVINIRKNLILDRIKPET